jgi:hypothetical protein
MRSTEGPPEGSRPGFAFATWRPHLQGCIRYDCQGDEAGIIMLRRVSHSCHLCSNCAIHAALPLQSFTIVTLLQNIDVI